MNKKVNLCFTNFFPIGSRTLQSFYLLVECEINNICHKSPTVYGGRPNFPLGKTYFWQIDISDRQEQIICQLFFFNQDSSKKTDKLISQVRLPKNISPNQQKQIIFYQESNKIGILTYTICQTNQNLNYSMNFSSHQKERQQKQQSSYILETRTDKKYIQLTYSQDFQDERYRIDVTPSSSFIKLDTYSSMTQNNIFDNLDESCIPERHLFSNDKSFMIDCSFQQKRQNELSSLQKWLKKLKDFKCHKNNVNHNFIELQPIIPQKYLELKQLYDAKLNFKYIKINEKNNHHLQIKSFILNFIDEQDKKDLEPLFQTSFSLSNTNQRYSLHNSIDQIKFKNFITQVPSNKNLELKITFKNQTYHKSFEEISGIFIKEKFLEEGEIPLFNLKEEVFGSLGYKGRRIQNASVQCLPPIEQNPFQVSNQYQPLSNIGSSPDKIQNLKFKIKQRKLNNIVVRKQVQKDFKIKKYSFDEQQEKQIALYSLNSPTRTKVDYRNMDTSKLSIKQDYSQFSSQNQFQRSNTQELPYFQLQTCNQKNQQTNRSQDSPKKYGISNLKRSFLNSSKKNEKEISPSKNSSKVKKQNIFVLESTNLTDLQEQQSEQQQSYLTGDTFNVSLNYSNSPVRKMSLLEYNQRNKKQLINPYKPKGDEKKSQSHFIIKISSVTVILYQTLTPEEEQSGKFLILKSDKGETFITETLFSNHLNLSWKNKSYQFTSSLIQISLYERTGYSSHCQNKHNFSTIIKFSDLMKAIKQNFYRQQIEVNGQVIGTIVLLYDILMKKQSFFSRNQQNFSQMQNKNTIKNRYRGVNKSEMSKKSITKNQEKSTIKIQSPQKNRKRAKTLQNNKNSTFLPSIERGLSRKPKLFEGGKNVKIGRAQRFLSYNMVEA